MEANYGVGVTNRFAMPDDVDVEVEDPTDIIQSAEKKAIEQKKEVKKPAPKGKVAEKPQPKSAATDKAPRGQGKGNDRQSQPRGERGERGERKPREGGDRRPRREGNTNRDSGFGGDSSFGVQQSSFGESSTFGGEKDTRERGRGRGRGRGGPRGAGAPREGRREFDRRSGSDRSNVRAHDKREGGGAHNWGRPAGELTDEPTPAQNGEESQTPPAEAGEPVEGAEPKTNDENAAPAVEDEDSKQMTLDEYKSLQKETRYKAEMNMRKAGENEDQTKWKNTRRYERPVPVNDEEPVEYVIEKKDQRSHSRQTVDMNFQFTADQGPRSAPAPGGRRGGRGAGRGGRGGNAGGRSHEGGRKERGGNAYNFRDDDFPALG